MRRTAVTAAALAALALALGSLTGCSDTASSVRADGVIQVPSEIATLQEAERLAEPGDLILVAPGTYDEQLEITTPDVDTGNYLIRV